MDPIDTFENDGTPDERLRELARKLAGDASTADDLIQETWIVSRTRRSREVREPVLWLRGVLANLARSRRRDAHRRAEQERHAARPERLDPHASGIEADVLAQLRSAIEALDAPLREVVELHYFQELGFVEIAERLGRPDSTIRSQHARALEKLRTRRPRGWSAFAWIAGLFARERSDEARSASALPTAAWLLIALSMVGGIAAFTWLEDDAEERALLTGSAPELERDGEPALRSSAVAHGDAREPEPRSRAFEAASGSVSAATSARPGGPERAADGARIEVFVRDVSGTPIPSAELSFRAGPRAGARRFLCDASGRASIPRSCVESACEDGREHVRVAAFADGWGTRFEQSVALDESADTRVELVLADVEMRVAGRVFGPGGAPLAGLTVLANAPRVTGSSEQGERSVAALAHDTVTRADGRFTLAWLPREPLVLEFLSLGASVFETTIDPRDAERELVFRLDHLATLAGTVLLPDGRPARGARIELEKYAHDTLRAVTTDASGRFRIDGLRPGWVRVTATLQEGAFLGTLEHLFLAARTECDWEARLAAHAPLELRIVGPDDAPLACARVRLVRLARPEELPQMTEEGHLRAFDRWNRELATDAQGAARLFPAPPFPFQVEVFSERHGAAFPVHVERDVTADASPRTVRVAAIATPGGLAGRVVHADGSAPEGGFVGVTALDTGAEAQWVLEPSTGAFAIDRLPPGRYDVVATLPLHGRAALGRFEVAPGVRFDAGRLVLPALATLRVDWGFGADATSVRQLQLAQQVEMAGHWVALSVETSAVPRAEGWKLFPGVYSLQAGELRDPELFRVASLAPGSELTVELGPDGTFALPLRVAGATSAVHVRALRSYDDEVVFEKLWTPDEKGAIAGYVRVPAGEYVITAEAEDGRRASVEAHVADDQLLEWREVVLE